MKERIRKLKLKYKMKLEGSLVRKIMKLKGEIRHLKKELDETRKQNHKLIDQKTLDNIKIRELILEGKHD